METLQKNKNSINPILPIVAVVLVGAIAFGAYKLGQQSVTDSDSSTCHNCDFSASTFQSISVETAHQLADNYKQICQPALNATLPNPESMEDARSAQVSLTELKTFIYALEEQTCRIDSLRNLGVRFYYGRYPDLNRLTAKDPLYADLHTVNPEYSFLHTLFVVPAYIGSDGQSHDLPARIEKTGGNNTVLIMNHMNLSPPPFLTSDPSLLY